MDLEFDARYEEFRMQVRDFVAKHRPARNWRLGDGNWQDRVAWLSLQIEHGYWARTIPKEYGGYGAEPDLLATVIMDEEFNKAGVIRGMMAQGPSMLVPTLLSHGSEEQCKRWIGPTMRGEVIWCQGYSEPGAGSDLASLQTSATEDGDDFIINGQKIWTSTADMAQMCFILVRTEPDAKKHEGISYILLPMDTPGIEVQPMRTMAGEIGENSFNQVFFTDVRVPKANVVGKRGEGWRIANTTLKHERNSLNANAEGTLMRLARLMSKETVNGAPAMASPVYRDRLMKLQARALSMKHHGMRMLTCSSQGRVARGRGARREAPELPAQLRHGKARPRRHGRARRALRPQQVRARTGLLAGPLDVLARAHHRRRHCPDPEEHHRRTRTRAAA